MYALHVPLYELILHCVLCQQPATTAAIASLPPLDPLPSPFTSLLSLPSLSCVGIDYKTKGVTLEDENIKLQIWWAGLN